MSFTILKVAPVSSNLFNSDDKENIGSCIQPGGIFGETKYFWLVRGSYITVGCTKTGLIIGNWKFGTTSKTTIKINCVTELPRENTSIPFLIIGLKCNEERGMICIFQFTSSKVLRAIEINNEVRTISVISIIRNKCLLPEVLTLLDGVIAVGTSCGGLLLLDLCLQEYENATSMCTVLKDEKSACQTMDLELDDISLLESHKNLANLNTEHLAIYLNDLGNCSKQIFNFKDPEGTVLAQLSNQDVVVTALYYCSQLCSLFVGYNFGAWQIWNLKEMDLVYTSPILEKNMPVTHFAVQEPCDDPRAFCYIWVIYNNVEPLCLGFPLAVMYALLFDTKIWHDKYGFFYQGLFSCQVRFQRELVLIEDNDEKPFGGYCTGLSSISKSVSNLNSTQEFPEDGFSYCFFTWNTWTIGRKFNTYLTLFDLNQWYKEQMPSYLHKRSKHVDSYTITVSISNFLKSVNNEEDSSLCDVKVDFKSLLQFKGAVKLEEHYYPSSLSFNFFTLKEKGVILIKNRGCQQNLLYQIITQGPVCLTNPSECYLECIRTGLTPLFVEHENYDETNVDFQREFILNVALEQQLFCWLCKCATVFSCNFKIFMQWAWNRAHVLKQNADELCNNLFRSTGMSLDSNAYNTFNNCLKQLKLLKDIYDYVLKNLNILPNILPCLETITEQLKSMETTIAYLEIIKWSINAGLLPETPPISSPLQDRLNKQFVPYPINDINIFFENRRELLTNKNNSEYSSPLFIDNLINSGKNRSVFKKYPLPSLRNLHEIYLEDSLGIITKHQIFIYTLLDIIKYLDKDGYEVVKNKLRMFLIVFKIPSTVTKVVEAFWQLDHGNYGDAVYQLLNPHIHLKDIELWHHKILLQTLLIQEQYKLALLYLQIKKPPLSQESDLRLIITLYISNSMLDEAYHFVNMYGDTKLIRHFFEECINKNKFFGLLSLSLNIYEEEIFIKYLNETQNSQLKKFKALYIQQKYNAENEIANYFSSRRKEIMNTKTVSKKCLPVTVYPQIFENSCEICPIAQKEQDLGISNNASQRDITRHSLNNVSSENICFRPDSILMETPEKNSSTRSLDTEKKRSSSSQNSFKNNSNERLDNVAEGASKNRDNFGDINNLSLQKQFESDANELNSVISKFKINEKKFISNEKEVLEKVIVNVDTESSFSAPNFVSSNKSTGNCDPFKTLRSVCLKESEFVSNKGETPNRKSKVQIIEGLNINVNANETSEFEINRKDFINNETEVLKKVIGNVDTESSSSAPNFVSSNKSTGNCDPFKTLHSVCLKESEFVSNKGETPNRKFKIQIIEKSEELEGRNINVNANETSEFEINEKDFISNEKEVSKKVIDNVDTESSSSAPNFVSSNKSTGNCDPFKTLHSVCLKESEFVSNKGETPNRKFKIQIIEKSEELEGHNINVNSNETSEFEINEEDFISNEKEVSKKVIDNVDTESSSLAPKFVSSNKSDGNRDPFKLLHSVCLTESEFVSNKGETPDYQSNRKSYVQIIEKSEEVEGHNINVNANETSEFEINEEDFISNEKEVSKKINDNGDNINEDIENLKIKTKKQISLGNSLTTDQHQKYTSANKKNYRKPVSLIRVKISPRKDIHNVPKNILEMEEKSVAFKTNKNIVYQREQRSPNKYLEKSDCESEAQFRTNCNDSSFKSKVEKFPTRLRLTPKKGKEKSKKSGVSLIRLRVTPIKEMTKSVMVEDTELNKQINISFSQPIQSGNDKLTISACKENKTDIKGDPILEKLVNRSNNKEIEKRNLSKEFLDHNCEELFSDTNKENVEIASEKTERKINESIKSPNKIEEKLNSLLYEQENSNSLSAIQEHSHKESKLEKLVNRSTKKLLCKEIEKRNLLKEFLDNNCVELFSSINKENVEINFENTEMRTNESRKSPNKIEEKLNSLLSSNSLNEIQEHSHKESKLEKLVNRSTNKLLSKEIEKRNLSKEFLDNDCEELLSDTNKENVEINSEKTERKMNDSKKCPNKIEEKLNSLLYEQENSNSLNDIQEYSHKESKLEKLVNRSTNKLLSKEIEKRNLLKEFLDNNCVELFSSINKENVEINFEKTERKTNESRKSPNKIEEKLNSLLSSNSLNEIQEHSHKESKLEKLVNRSTNKLLFKEIEKRNLSKEFLDNDCEELLSDTNKENVEINSEKTERKMNDSKKCPNKIEEKLNSLLYEQENSNSLNEIQEHSHKESKLEKLVNRSTKKLLSKEIEKRNLSKEFLDNDCEELLSDTNKENVEINSEKTERKMNDSKKCPNKIEEKLNSLLYEQENSNSLNDIQEYSHKESKLEKLVNRSTNKLLSKKKEESNLLKEYLDNNRVEQEHSHRESKLEKEIVSEYKIEENFKSPASIDKNEKSFCKGLNNQNCNKIETFKPSDFEKEKFLESVSQISFLEGISLNPVSSGKHDVFNEAIIIDDNAQIGTYIPNNMEHEDILIANMTVKCDDDSEKVSENKPDTSSVQCLPKNETEVIEISDPVIKEKRRSTLISSSSTVDDKSDFLNNAFLKENPNFTAGENSENREENECIKFVWVAEKGVNTSFPYESEKSSDDEECEPNKSDDKIEMFKKFQEENTVNIEKSSQTVNASRRKSSLLQKRISTSKDIEGTHSAKIT